MKNKGFTLIELLAVIVILAIIALIATPIILNIINDSKEESKKRSAENYFDAVELAVANKNTKGKFNPDTCEMTGNIGECTGEFDVVHCGGETVCTAADLEVKVDGEVPTSGTIIFENGSVAAGTTLFYGNLKMFLGENNKITTTPIKPQNLYVDEAGVKINLPKGLTPVVYEDYKWKIASVEDAWYDYNNQKWANAVILEDGVSNEVGTELYVTSNSYNDINVKAMFVYIPRYSYTIGNTYGVQLEGGSTPSQSTPGAIDIKFVDKTIKDLGTANYTGATPSNWYTHPAFTFGNKELEGIWVGKFELSHKQKKSTSTDIILDCHDENCKTADDLIVLPDVIPLTYNSISSFYYSIRSMSRNENGFGIDKVDTHMIKNSEWGAVAYLSQSKYGKYGNPVYTGADKEIYTNALTSRTGGTSTAPSTSNPPNANTGAGYSIVMGTANWGPGASTTGNVNGIYDMSGGNWEFVMANFNNELGSSGFTSLPNSKYYDKYTQFGVGDIGHALSETSDTMDVTNSWYNDQSNYFTSTCSWLKRSKYGSKCDNRGVCWYTYIGDGIFSYDYHTGTPSSNGSTRVVLVSN